ncbi:MAG: glycoside hydrolase family 2 TIM barrel-domain containing protein [Lacunisphaera sp.]|nr:glycoside hydrolase family 2 TIM barrel-domain containing protein [Lacunisphaera sp.]
MNITARKFLSRFAIFSALVVFTSVAQAGPLPRETDFNFDWKFALQPDTAKPTVVPLDDAKWRNVRLPHDWSVEAAFDQNLEGCTGYLPGGVGIYQKHFRTPVAGEPRSTYVLFDGVYNNATFWLNGKLLGENPYGYSPVHFDLTDLLAPAGADNVLTVHVDHSRYADSRWYSGSGIYRNVTLVSLPKLHIPIWGTYVTTPKITEQAATVRLEVKVESQLAARTGFELATVILDETGRQVADREGSQSLEPKTNGTYVQELVVNDPQLWGCDHPHLYRAVTTLTLDGKVVDEYETRFGIRSLRFAAGEGFFLNGKPTFMKGACLHHDGGLVGAAVPKGVWRRRLAEMKAAGLNAIRTSHNPPSQEFLDLCDEMGLLVQEELFDEFDYPKDKRENYHDRHDDYITRGYTEHFQQWAHGDLTRSILRDRNHASVLQWSIGNEIEWTYLPYRYITGFWTDPNDPQNAGKYWGSAPMFSPAELKERYDKSTQGKYILADTARRLAGWVKELDASRTTTANLILPQVSHVSGYADAVDIAGYSYRNVEIAWAQKHFPHKQVTINECPGNWDDWKHVLENPGVYGMFTWTGIAYLGEANKGWPQKNWDGDLLDLAGFRVQGWNYFKSIWVDEPHISLGTIPLKDSGFTADQLTDKAVPKSEASFKWRNSNMHWNYQVGDPVVVEVCSNLSTVELQLNGRSLGYRSMSECPDRLFRWVVPFEAGTLTARAGLGGREVVARLQTTSALATFTLQPDRSELTADGYDVAHLIVQLVDAEGRPVKTENRKVTFRIEGGARILGVDNGSGRNTQTFQADSIVTDRGRCLLILQANRTPGKVRVTATIDGMEPHTVGLTLMNTEAK